jgi:hypothetical protein
MDGMDLEHRGSDGKDNEIMIHVSVDERAFSQAEFEPSDTLSRTCKNILTHKRESESEREFIRNDTSVTGTPGRRPGTGSASPRTSKRDDKDLSSSECRLPFRLEWRQNNRHTQSQVEQDGGCDRCVPESDVGQAAVKNGCMPVQGGKLEMSFRQDEVKKVRGPVGERGGRGGRERERGKAVGGDVIKAIS